MKESFYFRHDYNSRNDGKLLKIRSKFGNESGYGLFWMLVEWMAESDDGSVNGLAIDELSLSFNVPEERIREFLDYCVTINLFRKEGETILSPRMIEHKKFRKERSDSGKEGAKKRWKMAQPLAQGIAEGMQRKGKERKEQSVAKATCEMCSGTKVVKEFGIEKVCGKCRED